MPKKGHSEEQIITALKQYESGEKVGASAVSSASARPCSTPGKSSMPGWACRDEIAHHPELAAARFTMWLTTRQVYCARGYATEKS